MTWVRIDDGFWLHQKVRAAGRDARDLFLASLGYCNQNLTDGFIPEYDVHLIAGQAMIPMQATKAAVESLCNKRTFDNPMWHRVKDGFHIHDFLSYQPSKEQVLKEREDNKRRQHEYRERMRLEREKADQEARNKGSNAVTLPFEEVSVTPLRDVFFEPNNALVTDPTRIPDSPSPGIPVPDDPTDTEPPPPGSPKAASKNGQSSSSFPAVSEPSKPAAKPPPSAGNGMGPPGDKWDGLTPANFVLRVTASCPPHWVPELEKLVKANAPEHPTVYRAGILKNWLNGDGTPEEPVPASPKAEPKPKPPDALDSLSDGERQALECEAEASLRAAYVGAPMGAENLKKLEQRTLGGQGALRNEMRRLLAEKQDRTEGETHENYTSDLQRVG